MQGRKNNILVISTDFDGCWFHNHGRLSEASRDPLIEHNPVILEKIKSKIKKGGFDKVTFMIGSNRQSQPVDSRNSQYNSTPSCFYALNKICQHIRQAISRDTIEFSVDTYLLSDTFGSTSIGENFNNALIHKQNYKFSDWFFDESKLTILYAQMHKIASENPDSKIRFSFYEDRYYQPQGKLLDPQDILHALMSFFKSNSDLIPNNITLTLHHYDGLNYTNVARISGKGLIDEHYQNSIKTMVECAGLDYDKDWNEYNQVLYKLTDGDGLEKFKSKRPDRSSGHGLFAQNKPTSGDGTEKPSSPNNKAIK